MNENTQKKALLFTGIVFLVVFCLFPIVWMLVVSFSKSPSFLVKGHFSFTLQNYADILRIKSMHFMDYLRNSFIVAIVSAAFTTLIASFAAYAVSRINFKGRAVLIITVLALSMFPGISMVGYLYKIMNSLHWINTYYALILPYIAFSLPLALWMLLSYFSQVPTDIDQAAQVDGASRLQILTRIIIPVSLPGVLSTVLLMFMFSFNEFLFALMLTTDFRARTIPVGIALFEGLHGETPWGYIMAGSALAAAPVMVIALFFQRYIIQGITKGAVKS